MNAPTVTVMVGKKTLRMKARDEKNSEIEKEMTKEFERLEAEQIKEEAKKKPK